MDYHGSSGRGLYKGPALHGERRALAARSEEERKSERHHEKDQEQPKPEKIPPIQVREGCASQAV